MKFLNGELVQLEAGVAFVVDKVVLAVGDRVDIHYDGPDRSRFNMIGDITIKSITLDPPEITYGHANPHALTFTTLEDQTVHIRSPK